MPWRSIAAAPMSPSSCAATRAWSTAWWRASWPYQGCRLQEDLADHGGGGRRLGVYFGLAVSLLLHSGLLAWALVSIHAPLDIPPSSTDAVAVDFVTISDVNKMRQGSRQSKL